MAGVNVDSQIFFHYDHTVLEKEEDDLKDAILFYYPQSNDIDTQCALCGQLMGMLNLMTSLLGAPPTMFTLTNNKFAVKHLDKYSLVLGGSLETPDEVLQRQLDQLYSLFAFHQCSIQHVLQRCRGKREAFLAVLQEMWNSYVPFVRRYDHVLSACFQSMPYAQLTKRDGGQVMLQGAQLLQHCQRHHPVLSGCVIHRNSILFTQLPFDVTFRLLLLRPQLHSVPCIKVLLDHEAPVGVQMLKVFLTSSEFDQLIKTSPSSAGSIKAKTKQMTKSSDVSTHSSGVSDSRASRRHKGRYRTPLSGRETDFSSSMDEATRSSSSAKSFRSAKSRTSASPAQDSSASSKSDNIVIVDEQKPAPDHVILENVQSGHVISSNHVMSAAQSGDVNDGNLREPASQVVSSQEKKAESSETSQTQNIQGLKGLGGSNIQDIMRNVMEKAEKGSTAVRQCDLRYRRSLSEEINLPRTKNQFQSKDTVYARTEGKDFDGHTFQYTRSSSFETRKDSGGESKKASNSESDAGKSLTFSGSFRNQATKPESQDNNEQRNVIGAAGDDKGTRDRADNQSSDGPIQDAINQIFDKYASNPPSPSTSNEAVDRPASIDEKDSNRNNQVGQKASIRIESNENDISNSNNGQVSECQGSESNDKMQKDHSTLESNKGVTTDEKSSDSDVQKLTDDDMSEPDMPEMAAFAAIMGDFSDVDNLSVSSFKISFKDKGQSGTESDFSGAEIKSDTEEPQTSVPEKFIVKSSGGFDDNEKSVGNKNSPTKSGLIDSQKYFNKEQKGDGTDGQRELNANYTVSTSTSGKDIVKDARDRYSDKSGKNRLHSETQYKTDHSAKKVENDAHSREDIGVNFPGDKNSKPSIITSDSQPSYKTEDPNQAGEDITTYSSTDTDANAYGGRKSECGSGEDTCSTREDTCGMREVTLYVQNNQELQVMLLLPPGAHINQQTLHHMWGDILAALANIDIELKSAIDNTAHKSPEPLGYKFLHYNDLGKTLQGHVSSSNKSLVPISSNENQFCNTAVTMHADFLSHPTLSDVTFRNHNSVVFGHKRAAQETYFRQSLARGVTSAPSEKDASLLVEQKAREKLRNDQDILMI